MKVINYGKGCGIMLFYEASAKIQSCRIVEKIFEK